MSGEAQSTVGFCKKFAYIHRKFRIYSPEIRRYSQEFPERRIVKLWLERMFQNQILMSIALNIK